MGKRRCIDYEKWMTLMKKCLTMIKMEDYDKKLLTIIKSEIVREARGVRGGPAV